MVRFHWHVEHGLVAHVIPGGFHESEESGVWRAECSVQTTSDGKGPASATFVLPPKYLELDRVQELGVAFALMDNADENEVALTRQLEDSLAQQGFIVLSFSCDHTKERRQERLFEKSLDACATSPYAHSVKRWLLGGIGIGARIAAVVAGKCRGVMSGYALLSYPLQAPMPEGKTKEASMVPPASDSLEPLLALDGAALFVKGARDAHCTTSALAQLLLSTDTLQLADARLVDIHDADGSFHMTAGGNAGNEVLDAVMQFVQAVAAESLEKCTLPPPRPEQVASDENFIFQAQQSATDAAAAVEAAAAAAAEEKAAQEAAAAEKAAAAKAAKAEKAERAAAAKAAAEEAKRAKVAMQQQAAAQVAAAAQKRAAAKEATEAALLAAQKLAQPYQPALVDPVKPPLQVMSPSEIQKSTAALLSQDFARAGSGGAAAAGTQLPPTSPDQFRPILPSSGIGQAPLGHALAMQEPQEAASPAKIASSAPPSQMDQQMTQLRWLQAQQLQAQQHQSQQLQAQQRDAAATAAATAATAAQLPQHMQQQQQQEPQQAYDLQQQLRLQMLIQQQAQHQQQRQQRQQQEASSLVPGFGAHLLPQLGGMQAGGGPGALQGGAGVLEGAPSGSTPQQVQPFGDLEGALQLQREQLARQQRLDQMQAEQHQLLMQQEALAERQRLQQQERERQQQQHLHQQFQQQQALQQVAFQSPPGVSPEALLHYQQQLQAAQTSQQQQQQAVSGLPQLHGSAVGDVPLAYLPAWAMQQQQQHGSGGLTSPRDSRDSQQRPPTFPGPNIPGGLY